MVNRLRIQRYHFLSERMKVRQVILAEVEILENFHDFFLFENIFVVKIRL